MTKEITNYTTDVGRMGAEECKTSGVKSNHIRSSTAYSKGDIACTRK